MALGGNRSKDSKDGWVELGAVWQSQKNENYYTGQLSVDELRKVVAGKKEIRIVIRVEASRGKGPDARIYFPPESGAGPAPGPPPPDPPPAKPEEDVPF